MSKVQIPVVLRPATAGAREVEATGATLAEVLNDLYGRYPELKNRLRAQDGLSPFVNIYVNGEDARTIGGADTPVGAGDTVTILPAMAGGC
ncbi:MAG TPA: MoaD/ThiS family protein [Chloroflexota bacterium]|jgi:molybdopterin converting factor small subunit|nr:MoaD/ThiS family protein [Chloroflexota bacterium]